MIMGFRRLGSRRRYLRAHGKPLLDASAQWRCWLWPAVFFGAMLNFSKILIANRGEIACR
jgi:hypothetical protein